MDLSHFKHLYQSFFTKIEELKTHEETWSSEIERRSECIETTTEESVKQAEANLFDCRESQRIYVDHANGILDEACKFLINDMHTTHLINSLGKDSLSWKADLFKKALPFPLLDSLPIPNNEVWSICDRNEQQLIADKQKKRRLEFTSHFWNLWCDVSRTESLRFKSYWKEQLDRAFKTSVSRGSCIVCRNKERDLVVLADKSNHVLCPHEKTSVCVCINKLHDVCSACMMASMRETFLPLLEDYFEKPDEFSNHSPVLDCCYSCLTCKGAFCAYQLVHIPSKKNIDSEKMAIAEEKSALSSLPIPEILDAIHVALKRFDQQRKK
jgi:hypothetical protein